MKPPRTPSIKQIMTDNGYPEGHIIRERCIPVNTFTDKDGTTYRWKAGEIPTEKDIVPPPSHRQYPTTDDILPYGEEELEARENHSSPPITPWTDNEVTGY